MKAARERGDRDGGDPLMHQLREQIELLICQALCALPPPNEMIWRYPGFPSSRVAQGVSNGLFFSGHTALAVFGAVELSRTRSKRFSSSCALAKKLVNNTTLEAGVVQW